jgi:AraC-like DNA-binding protein
MNITTIPALLGVFALAFLSLLFVKVVKQPAEDQTAKRLLILLLVGLMSMAFCLFYIYARMFQYWPRLANIEIGFTYWIGPSLYFYVRRLNGGPSPFAKPLNALHWLPAILIELALLPFFLMPLPEKVAYLAHPSGVYPWMMWATWAGFHIQLLLYILFCQPHLRVYRQRMTENFSDLSVINFRWLQLLCYGFIVQIAIERGLRFLVAAPPRGLSGTAGMAVYLFIIALTYSALGQSRLRFASGWSPPAPANDKYHRSGLQDHSAEYYLVKLNRLMAAERFYLEGDLSLKSLAERVNISPHHLSQILNEKLQKTFYDYVNELRVEYAKRALLKEPYRSITDIAFESGYNSKNSFYNSFKRLTGTIPSEYRRKHRESAPSSPPPTD